MPSISFYFLAAFVLLIVVILSVPSEGRTLDGARYTDTTFEMTR